PDLQVVRLRDDAAQTGPVLLEGEDQILEVHGAVRVPERARRVKHAAAGWARILLPGAMRKRLLIRATVSCVLCPLVAYGGPPNLDAISDREGHIHPEHVLAAQSLVRDSEQLEALYSEAMHGNPRAARAFHELESIYLPAIGQEVADRECLVPIKREL